MPVNQVHFQKHRVVIDGKQIKFSPIEFRLLEYLVNHAERVLPFDEILDNVWGNEFVGSNDIVHVYLSHLRRKIEKSAKNLRYFTSIHGVGYVFEKQVFDQTLSDEYDDELLPRQRFRRNSIGFKQRQMPNLLEVFQKDKYRFYL